MQVLLIFTCWFSCWLSWWNYGGAHTWLCTWFTCRTHCFHNKISGIIWHTNKLSNGKMNHKSKILKKSCRTQTYQTFQLGRNVQFLGLKHLKKPTNHAFTTKIFLSFFMTYVTFTIEELYCHIVFHVCKQLQHVNSVPQQVEICLLV